MVSFISPYHMWWYAECIYFMWGLVSTTHEAMHVAGLLAKEVRVDMPPIMCGASLIETD